MDFDWSLPSTSLAAEHYDPDDVSLMKLAGHKSVGNPRRTVLHFSSEANNRSWNEILQDPQYIRHCDIRQNTVVIRVGMLARTYSCTFFMALIFQ